MLPNSVREILEKEKESRKYSVMADILRILSLTFGRLWLFEIVNEINAFRRTLGISEDVSYDECLSAARELAGKGIITFEEKIRGTFTSPKGVPDVLVGLKIRNIAPILASVDEKLRKYIEIRRKVFGSLR